MAEAEGTQQPLSWGRSYWRSFRRHPRGYKVGGWCYFCCLSLALSLSEARLRDIKAIISPVEGLSGDLVIRGLEAKSELRDVLGPDEEPAKVWVPLELKLWVHVDIVDEDIGL